MAVQLTAELLTQQMCSSDVPDFDAAQKRIEASLREKLGPDANLDGLPDIVHMGVVDDFYATFE